MTPSQLAKAARLAEAKVARYAAGTAPYRTADDIMAEIARDKAAADARIEAWKASLKPNKGPQA